MKKALHFLLAISVAFNLVFAAPLLVLAATYSGSCGSGVTYSADTSSYVLTISGSGKMADYSYNGAPWNSYKSSLGTLYVSEGITYIGEYAFAGSNISDANFPTSLRTIGEYAFYGTNIQVFGSLDGITTIEKGAFGSCRHLVRAHIPSTVTSIGSDAFSSCEKLTEVSVGSSAIASQLTSENACGGLIKNATIIKIKKSITPTSYITSNYTKVSDSSIGGVAYAQYNKKAEPDHECTWSNNWTVSRNGHCRACTDPDCDETTELVPHIYDTNCDSECNVCGWNRTVTHNFQTVLSYDNDYHYYFCPDCGAKKEQNAHSFDGVCDPDCNVCEFTRNADHDFNTVYTFDDQNHWYGCKRTHCGVTKDLAPHIFDNACDTTCNTCDYVRTVPHSYIDDCDTTCEICGHERNVPHNYNEEWSGDTTNHWHQCLNCDAKKDQNAHWYDNDCDAECNTCGHTRTISHKIPTSWTADSSNHWHECIVCGERTDSAAHIPGPAATEIEPQRCTVCRYIITPALNHEHNFGNSWTSDREYHWYACDGCNDQKNKELHVYDSNCDAICNTCGYETTASHSFSGEWHKSATRHWYECDSCHTKVEESVHSWDKGTPSGDGILFKCTTCGAQFLSDTGELPSTDELDPPSGSNPKPGKPSGGSSNPPKKGNTGTSTTTIVIVVAVAVTGMGGAAAMIFVFKG